MTVRLDEWRIRKRDTEEWMRHRQLPPELQERVRRFVQYKWLATRGVDEESILLSLPLDLRREIQHHLCLSLVRRVCLYPFFVLIFQFIRKEPLLNLVFGRKLNKI
jgi:cyclic nucleotide gated channel